MKRNLKFDSFFILNQPKHITLSIVVITDVPLLEKEHNNLDKLSETSDIMFIFSKNLLNINKRKFTSLYNGCGYVTEGDSMTTTLLNTFEYSKEIFKKHIGTLIINNASNLGDENINKLLKNIMEVNNSSIIKPILNIKRLNSGEVFNIYKIKNKNIFKKLINKQEDFLGMHSLYTSESKFIYFKNKTIDIILKLIQEDYFIDIKYVESFKNYDVRYFLSSVIKKLNIDNLNQDIEELEINKLS